MIRVYYNGHLDASTKKIYDWLYLYKIKFETINEKDITKNIVKKMLSLSDYGFSEILVNKKASSGLNKTIYSKYKIDNLSTEELIQLILVYPSLLRSPIIYDDKKILVGCDRYELRRFLAN